MKDSQISRDLIARAKKAYDFDAQCQSSQGLLLLSIANSLASLLEWKEAE